MAGPSPNGSGLCSASSERHEPGTRQRRGACRPRQGDEHLQQKALQALSDLVVEAADIVGQLVALGTRSGKLNRNLRAAALFSERKLLEFLLDSIDDFADAIRPSDFGIAWSDTDLGQGLRRDVLERKRSSTTTSPI
jgi:hypothetical protein